LPKKKKDSELTSVGDVLAGLKTDPKLKQALELAGVHAEWAVLAGPKVAPHGRIKGLRDKVLYVEVDNSVWAHRYTYHKRAIIKNVNKHVGRRMVKDLFVLLAGEPFEDENEGDGQKPEDP